MISKKLKVIVITCVALAAIGIAIQVKRAQRMHNHVAWFMEVAAIVARDLTLKSWLGESDVIENWELPRERGFLSVLGAPSDLVVEVKPDGKIWMESGLVETPIDVVCKSAGREIPVGIDFVAPKRGHSWFLAHDTDWRTGKWCYYQSRDNLIAVIAKYGDFRKRTATFLPVPEYQLDGVPNTVGADLTYKWDDATLCIYDAKDQIDYRFIRPKKGDFYGTMTVKHRK
jgi:hypothetical protein